VFSTEAALQKLGLDPLDVIIVTDIGCHGIIDKSFATHTVHGLHGRSVAIAAGIRMGLASDKQKVLVFVGDGGATIGLKHIIAAAHRNIDMTVVVHNNMLYGMTGGQPSDLTPTGFKTAAMPEGIQGTALNLCAVTAAAGAGYVSRIVGMGDFSKPLQEAIRAPGFALVEVLGLCPNHGLKHNEGLRLSKIAERTGLPPMVVSRPDAKPFDIQCQEQPASLLDDLEAIPITARSPLDHKFRIVLGGSAGEGVQSATRLFAEAAIRSGLHVATKGSYPVTVGTGYSCSEIILSPHAIHSTVVFSPDALVVTSEDGMSFCHRHLEHLAGDLYIDETIESGCRIAGTIRRGPFRKRAGDRGAAVFALMAFLADSRLFPLECYAQVVGDSKIGKRIGADTLADAAQEWART
jgi:pyruvate/2-oxoacid:ferredoxin oxidoreductase beta subunit